MKLSSVNLVNPYIKNNQNYKTQNSSQTFTGESIDRVTYRRHANDLYAATDRAKSEARIRYSQYEKIAQDGWQDSNHPDGTPKIRCFRDGNNTGEIRRFDSKGNLVETCHMEQFGRLVTTKITSFNLKQGHFDEFLFDNHFVIKMNIGKTKNNWIPYYHVSYDTNYPYSPGSDTINISRVLKGPQKDPKFPEVDRIYRYRGFGTLESVQIANGKKRTLFGGEVPVYRTIKF